MCQETLLLTSFYKRPAFDTSLQSKEMSANCDEDIISLMNKTENSVDLLNSFLSMMISEERTEGEHRDKFQLTMVYISYFISHIHLMTCFVN
jgi:hypothetical protein